MSKEIPDTFQLFQDIQDLYEAKVETKLKDGQVTYPAGSLVKSGLGMQIQFRCAQAT